VLLANADPGRPHPPGMQRLPRTARQPSITTTSSRRFTPAAVVRRAVGTRRRGSTRHRVSDPVVNLGDRQKGARWRRPSQCGNSTDPRYGDILSNDRETIRSRE